jgi:hypothetical protein
MSSWEKLWRQFQCGLTTEPELVSAFIDGLEDVDVGTLIMSLPDGFRDLIRRFVLSGHVAWGIYYFVGVTAEESRSLHEAILEKNRRWVQAVKAYFEMNS